MVSDGKAVSNIHANVYLLMYITTSTVVVVTHALTHSLSLYRFFLLGRRLSFFVSLTVTINLSAFLSDVLRWTHTHVCIYTPYDAFDEVDDWVNTMQIWSSISINGQQ